MQKIVVSSFIPGADINVEFYNALVQYTRHNKADLYIPATMHNYIKDLNNPVTLATIDDLGSSFLDSTLSINNNIHITDYKTSINVIDPLSGLDAIAATRGSFILPFPRQRFKSVPRMLKDCEYPRAIWCTGTVSHPYYKSSKSGIKMSPFHVYGALVVEIENGETFHVRQLQWDGKGFFDLNKYYTSSGVRVVKDAVLSSSLGDDHVVHQSEFAMNTTIEQLKFLNPKHIFRHDTLDCSSISHHTMNKLLTRAIINLTLEEELYETSKSLKLFENEFKNAKHYQVFSNHPDHLNRYLDEGRYKEDVFNHILGLELALQKAKGDDVYRYAMNKYNKLPKTQFLSEGCSIRLAGYELANHGHDGNNGSRGNPTSIGLIYNGKVVTGHTHSGQIGVFGNPVNGCLTRLVLSYTSEAGGSSWTHTNTHIYKNGTFTQIHIIPNSSNKLG